MPSGNSGLIELTQWGLNKMERRFLQATFSNAFFDRKIFDSPIKFHWYLFLRVQLVIRQHYFRLCHCNEVLINHYQAANYYLNQWWPSATATSRREAMTWINDNPVPWTPMACRGHFKTQFLDRYLHRNLNKIYLLGVPISSNPTISV